jgi:hypothetical protein
MSLLEDRKRFLKYAETLDREATELESMAAGMVNGQGPVAGIQLNRNR